MIKYLVLVYLFVGTRAQNLGEAYCTDGRRVFTHLFEWKWTDVEKECGWLAENGYCALQLSPPQAHVVLPENNYPWWQRYQPVSYNLVSRGGTDAEFRSMVQTCNSLGVYIHVDAVVQHTTGPYSGVGSDGSGFDGAGEYYPAIPYNTNHFHKVQANECNSPSGNIEDWFDVQQLRFCFLYGLRDLRTGSEYVRNMAASYLNKLIDIGVSGFRLDAAKHIPPSDLQDIFSRLHDLPTQWFPANTKPFVYNEVIDMNDGPVKGEEYMGLGMVTEFKYSEDLGRIIRQWDGMKLADLKDLGANWEGYLPSNVAYVFVDNHDNQRGHGPGGDAILNFKDGKLYKIALSYTLAQAYGRPQVMSSYDFADSDAGPPSDASGNTNDVDCSSGDWICEHRWRLAANMARFHNTVYNTAVTNWWDNSQNSIAFGRGNAGFIVINNEESTLDHTFQTSMPAGEYCNVILCDEPKPPCSGASGCGSVFVDSSGQARIVVPNDDEPVVAIHV